MLKKKMKLLNPFRARSTGLNGVKLTLNLKIWEKLRFCGEEVIFAYIFWKNPYFFQNQYNYTPFYFILPKCIISSWQIEKYRIYQKIYAKMTSSPQNVNFWEIFNFKLNLIPFEPVDLAQTELKGYVLFLGIGFAKIKNPMNKNFLYRL